MHNHKKADTILKAIILVFSISITTILSNHIVFAEKSTTSTETSSLENKTTINTENSDSSSTSSTTEKDLTEETTTELPSTEVTTEASTAESTTEEEPIEEPEEIPGQTYYYHVSQYGANGADDLDDTEALQLALDEATEDSFTVITIPEGIYYISSTLYIQSNTTLLLTDKTIIRRRNVNAKPNKILGFNLLKTADSSRESSGFEYGQDVAHDILISGGVWDGGDIATATKVSNLMYMGHSSNITIENATIKNCYGSHAIEFAGIKNGIIRNCKFSDFRYGPNNYTSEAIQLDICYDDGVNDWTPSFDHDKTVCSNIVIENNEIVDYPRGIGSHHVLRGYRSNNIIIRNNKIKRSSSNTQGKALIGIFLMGTSNVNISNNYIYHYYYGVYAKYSDHLNINKNKFKYTTSGGIKLASCDVKDCCRRFSVKKCSVKKRTLHYSAQGMTKGNVKTRGKTYKFTKSKKLHKVKLKYKTKNKQKFSFYGLDNQKNKYYRTFYCVKKKKK